MINRFPTMLGNSGFMVGGGGRRGYTWWPPNLENLEKCRFLGKVNENLEKSAKTVEKAYKLGESQGIIFG